VGTIANVVGKNTSSGYWIISIPGNTNSTCWLWGKYATVSGNTNGLAEVAAPVQNTATATKPPTATLTAIIASLTPTNTAVPVVAAPAAPSNLNFAKTCINQGGGIYTYSGTFTWNDNSNNETGFNAYLSGPAFSNYSLPSNTTNLYINPDFPEANAVIFRVEAFNNNGASPSVQITITCP
jgi:hypothetical protein